MNNGKALIHNSFLILVSQAISIFLSLFMSIIIARYLGPTEFGIYALLISIQNIVILFSNFGFPIGLAKYISQFLEKDKHKAYLIAKRGFTLLLLTTMISVVIYLVLSNFIGDELYHEHLISQLILYSCLVVLGNALLSAIMGVAQGCQRIGLLALAQTLLSILSLTFIVVLFPYLGIIGILIGIFISQIIVFLIVLQRIISNEFTFRIRSGRGGDMIRIQHDFLRFSTLWLLSGIMVAPLLWIGNTQLTLKFGFEASGFFAIGYAFFGLIIIIPSSIAIPLMPAISANESISPERVELMIRNVLRYSSLVLLPLILALGLFSGLLIDVLFGSSFDPAVESVFLMSIAGYFYALSTPFCSFFTGSNKMRSYFLMHCTLASSFILLSFILVPIWGINGLCFSFIGAYILFFVSAAILSYKMNTKSYHHILPSLVYSSVFFLTGYALLILDSGLLEKSFLILTAIIVSFLTYKKEVVELYRYLSRKSS